MGTGQNQLLVQFLFWLHVTIIVAGIMMGLWLPLWLVAMMIIGHRFHLYLFDGCLFSRLQTRLGALEADLNFLQDASRKLFRKRISKAQAERVDQWILRITLSIAATRSLFSVQSIMDVALIFMILGGVSACWKMIKESRRKSITCSDIESCQSVRESDYSKLFGVKAEILGVLYFLGLLGTYGLSQLGLVPGTLGLLWACAAIGLLISLYFIYIQIIRVKQYCMSCMKTHFASIMIFFLVTFSQ